MTDDEVLAASPQPFLHVLPDDEGVVGGFGGQGGGGVAGGLCGGVRLLSCAEGRCDFLLGSQPHGSKDTLSRQSHSNHIAIT